MRKLIFCSYFLWGMIFVSLWGQEISIPIPENKMLYTEYTFLKSSPYLKKGVRGEGIIAMSGEDKFTFVQFTPTKIKITKMKEEISFSTGNAPPVKMMGAGENGGGGDIMSLLTGETEKVNKVFQITHSRIGEKEEFQLKPKVDCKETRNIEFIHFISIGDKLENLRMKYKNGTFLEFEFRNTVTGEKPDEALFD